MLPFESFRHSILSECEDDYVGLWSVIREAQEQFPNGEDGFLRDQVFQVLRELLLAGQITAGFPTPSGGFRRLYASPDEVLEQVRLHWPLGHRPTIGEGVGFTRAHEPTGLPSARDT